MVRVGRAIWGGIFRAAVALALIVGILLAAKHLAPPLGRWIGAQSESLRTLPAQQNAYADATQRFGDYARERRRQTAPAPAELRRRPDSALRARLMEIDEGLRHQAGATLSPAALAIAAARGDSDKLFAHYRAQAETTLLEAERQQIEALLSVRRDGFSLQRQRASALAELQASHGDWKRADIQVRSLQSRFMAPQRDAVCRVNPFDVGCEHHRALQNALERRSRAKARNDRALRDIRVVDEALGRLSSTRDVALDVGAVLTAQERALSAEMERLDDQAQASWLIVAVRSVREVLPAALLILAAAGVFPLLLKAALYFLVAPFAARRPPIRLWRDDLGDARALARSAVSHEIRLQPGQELLVAPEALQSTPHHAAKRTRWLLDWRLPLSSLASGLAGLTEIRVARADSVLVSATGGPEFEIALIGVGRGSALVLRPRALRGLMQDTAAPVRITRRWRFGLTAWLTLQFRYLVFHGPAVFILQGGRGVRLEAAGRGRGINQAATIGFSPGLAYRVARSETFGAYLLGKQALFNDSFEAGRGGHIHEEMLPSTAVRDPVRRALQGIGDALMKLFGL